MSVTAFQQRNNKKKNANRGVCSWNVQLGKKRWENEGKKCESFGIMCEYYIFESLNANLQFSERVKIHISKDRFLI